MEIDLERKDDHGDSQPDECGDEDAAEGGEGDALAVVKDGAQGAECAVPVLGAQSLEITIFLELQDDLCSK